VDAIGKHYLLATLEAMRQSGSWCGETHLQKCTYLLRELERIQEIPYQFIMYKHGPYSFDLHDDIGVLEASHLIVREATPPYGSMLRVTPLGRSYMDRVGSDQFIKGKSIESVSDEFSKLSVAELERFASAAYVVSENPGFQEAQLVERLIQLKPHISEELARDSFRRIANYPSE
jgi:uncharacterized protein YwgA